MEDPASRQSPIQTCFGGISGLAASSNFITTAQALKLQLVDCARVPVLTVLLHAQSSQCENAACFGVGPASTSKNASGKHCLYMVCNSSREVSRWAPIPRSLLAFHTVMGTSVSFNAALEQAVLLVSFSAQKWQLTLRTTHFHMQVKAYSPGLEFVLSAVSYA